MLQRELVSGQALVCKHITLFYCVICRYLEISRHFKNEEYIKFSIDKNEMNNLLIIINGLKTPIWLSANIFIFEYLLFTEDFYTLIFFETVPIFRTEINNKKMKNKVRHEF